MKKIGKCMDLEKLQLLNYFSPSYKFTLFSFICEFSLQTFPFISMTWTIHWPKKLEWDSHIDFEGITLEHIWWGNKMGRYFEKKSLCMFWMRGWLNIVRLLVLLIPKWQDVKLVNHIWCADLRRVIGDNG